MFRDHTKDAVTEYYQQCLEEGRNPLDPMDDASLSGHEAVQWARRRMYDSPLGNQSYPFDLCIRREDLEPPYAHTHGVDYIERLFLTLHVIQPITSMTDHRGIVYWSGVRYTNEGGDFVNWALAQWSIQNAVYIHAWYDITFQFLEMVIRWCKQLALELESDTRPDVLRNRWIRLEHLIRCQACRREHHKPEVDVRDQAAMDFLVRADYAHHLHRLRYTLADETTSRNYIHAMIPQHLHHRTSHRSECQIVNDLDEVMELMCFIVDVAQHLCSRVGPAVTSMRLRTRSIYLGASVSLVAFCPTWSPEYSWKPSQTNRLRPRGIPMPSLTNNHRFLRYLEFLNGRTLFYQPDSFTMQCMHAKHEDIGKAMEM